MFLSSFENKIDKKGRVSVPATFRSHLNSMGYNGFISYPSFNHAALEACSQDRIEKLSNTIFLYCIAPEANNNKPNFLGKILL